MGQESDPHGDGYNVHQSMIAIGSGGFSGKGFLDGTQTKFNFVPEQSTDFIFCTIGEEWGFLGSAFIVALYITFLLRIIFVAERQRSVFSKIYGYGVASILFFHVAINIANDHWTGASYWHSITFHQLWRILFMGFHHPSFYLYQFGFL